MSTQDLLQEDHITPSPGGESEFEHSEAAGQHDIGGPLWHPERFKPLKVLR